MNRVVVALTLVAVGLWSGALAQQTTHPSQKYRDTDVPTLLAAAKAGDADAMVWLGIRYSNSGTQVPRDEVQATQWYLKAANAGQAFGMFMSGLAFWSGRGVKRDVVEAYKWLDLSTKFTTEKNQPALTALEGLTRVLSPEQISEAKKREAGWEKDFQKRKKS